MEEIMLFKYYINKNIVRTVRLFHSLGEVKSCPIGSKWHKSLQTLLIVTFLYTLIYRLVRFNIIFKYLIILK